MGNVSLPHLIVGCFAFLALAGCTTQNEGGAPAQTSVQTAQAGDVAVTGTLTTGDGGFLVDLFAHNTGTKPVWLVSLDTACGDMPWMGRLDGPPGQELAYHDPARSVSAGCGAWTTHTLGPGASKTWNADPTCHVRGLCDNVWDGRLWQDGQGEDAPVGTYVWRLELLICDGSSPGQPVYECLGQLHHATLRFTAHKQESFMPQSDLVEVHVSVHKEDGIYLAEATAYNGGQQSLGFTQEYCQGSPWYAQLLGPHGDPVVYRDPNDHRLGCPGFRDGVLGSGQWANWTSSMPCNTYRVCDNVWDGRIWIDGEAQEAPAGTYTWMFWFPYYQTPAVASQDGGAFVTPQGYRVKQVMEDLEIQ